MARKASPWFWPERNAWFTILNGQRLPLGDHPADLPPPQKRKGKWVIPASIEKEFHALLANPQPENSMRGSMRLDSGPVVSDILDKFLDWTLKNKAARTFEWYRDHLQAFLNHLGSKPLLVTDLKPFHVIEWIDKHPDWSSAYRRGAIIAAQRPFNWAEELGYIPANPIKKIKKPQPQRRDNPVTTDDFTGIIERYAEDDPFRDLLEFAWHSGCRPQEARLLEARHVHLAAECIVIPKEEAKGKRRARVILLEGKAMEIVARLLEVHPEGKLFRNEDGKSWKRFAIANRFDRLHLTLGIEALNEQGISIPPLPRFNRRDYQDKATLLRARKDHQLKLKERRKQILKLARTHSKKFALVDTRHGFCQRMLESGANHMAVAELMGHANGRMVSETYSHMNKATTHLRATLKKASEGT
jgi:integrase